MKTEIQIVIENEENVKTNLLTQEYSETVPIQKGDLIKLGKNQIRVESVMFDSFNQEMIICGRCKFTTFLYMTEVAILASNQGWEVV